MSYSTAGIVPGIEWRRYGFDIDPYSGSVSEAITPGLVIQFSIFRLFVKINRAASAYVLEGCDPLPLQ